MYNIHMYVYVFMQIVLNIFSKLRLMEQENWYKNNLQVSLITVSAFVKLNQSIYKYWNGSVVYIQSD